MALFDHRDDAGGGGGAGGEKPGGPRCPICKAATVTAHRPFCSKRCAHIDLHRWLVGVYRVPAKERPEPEEDGEDKN